MFFFLHTKKLYMNADVICLSYLCLSKMNQAGNLNLIVALYSKNFKNIEVIILRGEPCQDSPKQIDKIFSKYPGMTN